MPRTTNLVFLKIFVITIINNKKISNKIIFGLPTQHNVKVVSWLGAHNQNNFFDLQHDERLDVDDKNWLKFLMMLSVFLLKFCYCNL